MNITRTFLSSRFTLAVILSLSLILLCGIAFSLGTIRSSAQGRNFKIKTFKDMPVEIHRVNNLQSETWFNDLEIEVKNVSAKPIYFMAVYIIFPDEKGPGGAKTGILLTYGDPKNGSIGRYANPQDEHLLPGETHIFTIPEIYRKGLETKHKKFSNVTKNLLLKFSMVNFGDGQGFEAGQSRDLRGKISEYSPPEEHLFKRVSWHASTSTSTLAQDGCGGGNCL